MISSDHLDKIWDKFSPSTRVDLIDAYRECYRGLTETDHQCVNICPLRTLKESSLDETRPLRGVPGSNDPCELCAVFPEIRSDKEYCYSEFHCREIKNRCPCFHFGREDATARLKRLLDRIGEK